MVEKKQATSLTLKHSDLFEVKTALEILGAYRKSDDTLDSELYDELGLYQEERSVYNKIATSTLTQNQDQDDKLEDMEDNGGMDEWRIL